MRRSPLSSEGSRRCRALPDFQPGKSAYRIFTLCDISLPSAPFGLRRGGLYAAVPDLLAPARFHHKTAYSLALSAEVRDDSGGKPL
jgi:hypothetical protein